MAKSAGGTVFTDTRESVVRADPARVFRAVSRIGGGHGWYAWQWLWQVRGWLDRLAGGPGLRRGRRHPDRVSFGEALDFWRVTGVEPDRRLSLSSEEPVLFSRPSINVLFETAADAYGPGLLGVVLTGANNDGAQGLSTIMLAGGTAIIEDPADAYQAASRQIRAVEPALLIARPPVLRQAFETVETVDGQGLLPGNAIDGFPGEDAEFEHEALNGRRRAGEVDESGTVLRAMRSLHPGVKILRRRYTCGELGDEIEVEPVACRASQHLIHNGDKGLD